MPVEPFSFFIKIQKIQNSETLFPKFESFGLKYYYFHINSTYYLFLFGKTNPSQVLDLCYRTISILEELNTKQRKLRSLRGFLLYALEILETAGEEEIEVVETNLPPLFWKRVKNVLRQNQKGILINFLFGNGNLAIRDSTICVEDVLQNLQTEVDFLKNKVEMLETYTNFLLAASKVTKNEGSFIYSNYNTPSIEIPLKVNLISPNEITEEEQLQEITN